MLTQTDDVVDAATAVETFAIEPALHARVESGLGSVETIAIKPASTCVVCGEPARVLILEEYRSGQPVHRRLCLTCALEPSDTYNVAAGRGEAGARATTGGLRAAAVAIWAGFTWTVTRAWRKRPAERDGADRTAAAAMPRTAAAVQ